MQLPQYNARLLAVVSVADDAVVDLGAQTGGHETVWEGNTDAYVTERRVRRSSESARDIVAERIVYVPAETVIDITDQITVSFDGEEHTWRVVEAIRHGYGIDVLPYYELRIEES